MLREYAVVAPMEGTPRTRHYYGLPPELTGGVDQRRLLSVARVVLLKQTDEGYFLYRYSGRGEYVGDTWHRTLDDARYQATFEYGDALGDWRPVPDTAGDPHAYAAGCAREPARDEQI